MDMEVVKSFNNELSSLYDFKPPISKAKMTSITKAAIKAIKFYKHVVQSVEKFIQKCKVEYKIPGLYVIDSIVRQSRHQFGQEKDVFAPRFIKNIKVTFYYIFQCAQEEKSKVVRVLNLWQKNSVFPAEIIQPLFDLADPNHPLHIEIETQLENNKALKSCNSKSIIQVRQDLFPDAHQDTSQSWDGQSREYSNHINSEEKSSSLKTQANHEVIIDNNLIHQLQHLQHVLTQNQPVRPENEHVQFNKKLLEFDYGEEEEEEQNNIFSVSVPLDQTIGQLLANPELLKQLQHFTTQKTDNEKIPGLDGGFTAPPPPLPADNMSQYALSNLSEWKETTESTLNFNEVMDSRSVLADEHFGDKDIAEKNLARKSNNQPVYPLSLSLSDSLFSHNKDFDQRQIPFSLSSENIRPRNVSCDGGRDKSVEKCSPSIHENCSSRNQKSQRSSRSISHDRKRSNSRNRQRKDKHSSSQSRDQVEREKERERKRKGLVSLRKDYLTGWKAFFSVLLILKLVCSTTLWVGHLSKLVHQEELSDTFGQYGEILSIDLIPPRGCAFICMNRRQDAVRALQKLKNHKLQGKTITLAWAPGKGVKGKEYKDYWEVEQGVSFIPYSRLSDNTDLEKLEEGGMIDEDSVPDFLHDKMERNKCSNVKSAMNNRSQLDSSIIFDENLRDNTTVNFATVSQYSAPFIADNMKFTPVAPLMFPPASIPPCMPIIPMGIPPPTIPQLLISASQPSGFHHPSTHFPLSQHASVTVSIANNVPPPPPPLPPVTQKYEQISDELSSQHIISVERNDDAMDVEMEDTHNMDTNKINRSFIKVCNSKIKTFSFRDHDDRLRKWDGLLSFKPEQKITGDMRDMHDEDLRKFPSFAKSNVNNDQDNNDSKWNMSNFQSYSDYNDISGDQQWHMHDNRDSLMKGALLPIPTSNQCDRSNSGYPSINSSKINYSSENSSSKELMSQFNDSYHEYQEDNLPEHRDNYYSHHEVTTYNNYDYSDECEEYYSYAREPTYAREGVYCEDSVYHQDFAYPRKSYSDFYDEPPYMEPILPPSAGFLPPPPLLRYPHILGSVRGRGFGKVSCSRGLPYIRGPRFGPRGAYKFDDRLKGSSFGKWSSEKRRSRWSEQVSKNVELPNDKKEDIANCDQQCNDDKLANSSTIEQFSSNDQVPN